MKYEDPVQELEELRRRVAELEILEESCRSSETAIKEMYRKVVEDLPDLICRFRPDTTITFVNEAYAKYFGRSVDDLIGKSFIDFIPEEHHEHVRAGISSLSEESPLITVEHKVIAADGTVGWQIWRDRALFDRKGKITEIQSIGQDITAQKEAEEALRAAKAEVAEERAKAEAVIECMGDAVSVRGRDFRVIYQNDVHKGLVGGDKVGQVCYEAYADSRTPCNGCAVEAAFKDGGVHSLEKSKEDGKTIHIVASPLRNSQGEIIAGIEIVRDITKLKEAEGKERDLHARIETLLEAIPYSVYFKDAQGRHVVANQACCEYLGLKKEQILGKTCEELMSPEAAVCCRNSDSKVFEERRTIRTEDKLTGADGGEIFVETTKVPLFDGNGNVQGLVGMSRDITDRKKSEDIFQRYQHHLQDMVSDRTAELTERTAELTAAIELLQEQISERTRGEKFIKNILESIDESLIVLDRDYRIVSANRSFCESVEMPLEEVVGKHCHELLHMSADPCFEMGEDCSVRKVYNTGEPAAATHIHKHNGGSLNVETKTYPMRDEEGNISSVIQIIHDVTEKRKLEEQLRHSQKMEAIGQLAGGVAHDFNNRLAAIMNYAFILKTSMGADNPLLVHVNQIMSSSERAAHLTQNLLTFSRKHVINPRPVKLNDVVEGIEKLLVRVIGEDIELNTSLSDEELVVMADSGQIEHILINLATNARDAIRGQGRVAISTSRTVLGTEFFQSRSSSRPGHYALISFIDSGKGMDAETKSKIFEPFFTTKEVGKGTGLGLSIVYGIVKQHGGYITVESEPGLGTAFYIFLPLLPVKAERAAPEISVEPERGSETILLVEDDEDVRKPLRHMLEGFGYEVIEAMDGKDAVERFLHSRKSIGLLVLDVVLPGINGIDVLREIRKVDPNIRAIFTSGYSKEHVWSKGLPMPGTAFLSKPVAPEVLLEKVREALDG